MWVRNRLALTAHRKSGGVRWRHFSNVSGFSASAALKVPCKAATTANITLSARIEQSLPTEEDFNRTMGYMERFFAFAVDRGIGLGGPDIVPYRRGQMRNSYPFFNRRHEELPLVAMAVQGATLTYTNPRTGNRFTREEFIDFATGDGQLGARLSEPAPEDLGLLPLVLLDRLPPPPLLDDVVPDLEAPGDDPRHVEKIVDQLGLQPRTPLDGQHASLFRPVVEIAGANHRCPSEKSGHRSAELVGESGEECIFLAAGLLGFDARRPLALQLRIGNRHRFEQRPNSQRGLSQHARWNDGAVASFRGQKRTGSGHEMAPRQSPRIAISAHGFESPCGRPFRVRRGQAQPLRGKILKLTVSGLCVFRFRQDHPVAVEIAGKKLVGRAP